MIGEIKNRFNIKGNKTVTLYTTKDQGKSVNALDGVSVKPKDQYSSDQINHAINTLRSNVKIQSDACLQNAQGSSLKATIQYKSSDQKYHLDLPEEKGTYYVTLDKSIFEKNEYTRNDDTQNTVGKFRQDGALRITAHSGQSIVFNVTNDFLKSEHEYTNPYDPNFKQLPENGFELTQFMWNNEGSGNYTNGQSDLLATSVIWNLPNVTYLNIVGSIAGVIYAPNAKVHVTSTSAGWIVADEVHIESGEWHNVSHYPYTPTPPESIKPINPDASTTPGKDNTGGNKGDKETVKPGNEGGSKENLDTPKPGTGETGKSSDGGKTGTGKTDKPSDGNSGTQTPSTGDNRSSSHTPTTPTEPGTPSTPVEVPVTPTTPVTPGTPSTPTTPSVDTPTTPTNTVITPNPEKPKNTEPTTTPTAPVHTTHNDVQNNKSNAQNESGQPVTVTHTGKTVKGTAVSPKTSERNTASVQNTSSVQAAGTAASATDTSIPKTADQTSLLLYVTLFGGAAAALAAALVLKRKDKE